MLHVGVVVYVVHAMQSLAIRLATWRDRPRWAVILSLSILGLLGAHTVEIWIWAAVFLFLQELSNVEEAIYFATVTYTTLGYGDVTLSPHVRNLGTLAAVTGLLTFGISTAVLVGLVGRLAGTDNRRR